MVGKILLVVLFVILALLVTVLLIPVYVRVTYEHGEINAVLKYARFTIPLASSEKNDGEETKKENKPPKAEKEEKKPSKKPTWEQIQYTLDTLPKVILKALKRTGRRIWIDPLKVHVLVATADPADTAVLYGKLEGFLAAFLPMLHRTVRIREQDIQLFPDFCEDRMDFLVDAGIGVRPGGLLAVLLLTAGGMIKWYIGFRRRAEKTPAADGEKKQTTACADTAASAESERSS